MPDPATSTTSKKSSAAMNAARIAVAAAPLALAALHGATSGGSKPPPAPVAVTGSAKSGAGVAMGAASPGAAPAPMLKAGQPVDWFFVFKLNGAKFPKCGEGTDTRTCAFDPAGTPPPTYATGIGQRYVVATNIAPTLVDGGPQCLGDSTNDPVGATFNEVYTGGFHYLIWNDQFHDTSPAVQGCSGGDCGAPWGHSKGMLAWNDAGEGFVMQVSTPSWPNAGNPKYHQAVGNTLGCIVGDNDVGVSQHFFAMKLTELDLMHVLTALSEASVVTDPANPQVANLGGPDEVVKLASTLGVKVKTATLDPAMPITLSNGVKLIAKPSNLNVPPWQMVSAVLGGVSLRAATWWASPFIPSTTADSPVPACWDSTNHSIPGKPGAVDIAISGTWAGQVFSLKGSPGTNGNHAKIGVSTSGTAHYAIFGDENQQGSLDGPDGTCDSSQNGRGGMFFVMDNAALQGSITALIKGDSAPVETPEK